jgi:hypothetical protein
VWAKLHRLVLDELGARGELDWSRCVIDSVNMRALKKGDLTGPDPVDRGKYSSKIRLITERSGLPISIGIPGADPHDSQATPSFVPTRATTTPVCGDGYVSGASRTGSPAREWSPCNDWAATVGP